MYNLLLSWKNRLKIGYEIASVMAYLHTAFPRPIIHRDINPYHFFLDQDCVAMLSSFLFSISLPEGKTMVKDKDFGSLGYLAPELLSSGLYSERTDVFNFGILLLNLVSGSRICFTLSQDDANEYLSLSLSGRTCLTHSKDAKDAYEYLSAVDGIGLHVKNHGIDGIGDPMILEEGGGIHEQHQFQLVLRSCEINAEKRPTMTEAA